MVLQEEYKQIVYSYNIHKVLINLMLRQKTYIVREAALCMNNLLKNPHGKLIHITNMFHYSCFFKKSLPQKFYLLGLLFWQNFSSNKVEIDQSLQNYVLKRGDPKRYMGTKIEATNLF